MESTFLKICHILAVSSGCIVILIIMLDALTFEKNQQHRNTENRKPFAFGILFFGIVSAISIIAKKISSMF